MIRLRTYDPGWPLLFAAERSALEEAIGGWASGGIHHVGATAIEGVDAEPTIDILVGTRDADGAAACRDPLAALGYQPEQSSPDCLRLSRAVSEGRFELHLVPVDRPRYSETLVFRERLRADRQVALGYAGMKRDLVDRHAGDRRRYADGKAELIQAVLALL